MNVFLGEGLVPGAAETCHTTFVNAIHADSVRHYAVLLFCRGGQHQNPKDQEESASQDRSQHRSVVNLLRR